MSKEIVYKPIGGIRSPFKSPQGMPIQPKGAEGDLLDIKPYAPDFDQRKAVRIGWLTGNVYKLKDMRDDGRFGEGQLW